MGFELPGMLWGLLAAGVPIIIHFIQRRRARVLRFASLEFLLVGDARQARRFRVQQWLMLGLRVLLLAALALALAKPYVLDDSGPSVATGEPSAVILVLDDSASMDATAPSGERRFETMIEAARERIEAAGPLARFGLVTMGRPSRTLTDTLTHDRSLLERSLDGLRVGHGDSDTHQALSEARRLLATSVDEAHVIWIGSDRARHAWSNVGRLRGNGAGGAETRLEFMKMEDPSELHNVSIDSVTTTGSAGPNGETTFEVLIHNHGSNTASTEVRVRIGERAVAVAADVAPGGTTVATLLMALPSDAGSRVAMAELTQGGGALALDDRFHFEQGARRSLRVAVVNGSPRSVPWLDEVFFVRAGLLARGESGERWNAEHVQVADLTSGLLAHTDVVILANVGSLSDGQALALRDFVKTGGGLFIAVGDQLSANSNLSYGSLLPLPIRSMKRGAGTAGPRDDATPGLEIVATDHPIVRPFVGAEAQTFTRTVARTTALLTAVDRAGLEVLARWGDGAPAFLEVPLGEGRVTLLTTSLDRDGSDLVLRTSFVPFLQRSVAYLAGRFDAEGRRALKIGEVVHVEAPPGEGPLVLTGPQGLERPIDPKAQCEGVPARCELEDLHHAGAYSLARAADRGSRRTFSLNITPQESALASFDPVELTARLQGDAPARRSATVERTDATREMPTRRGDPVWPMALVSLFGLLLAEGWFALRGV